MIRKLPNVLFAAIAAIALLCWADESLWHDAAPCGPQTTDEVIAIARDVVNGNRASF